jgi:hypothetical protein
MSDHAARWQEVADRAEALALKLKLHMEQAGGDAREGDALERFREATPCVTTRSAPTFRRSAG